jgi:hypothetical protein
MSCSSLPIASVHPVLLANAGGMAASLMVLCCEKTT